MKKLFIINILLLISSFGFSQHQNSTATITIEPPSDAVWNEIFCYCVEYIESANVDKKDAVWKSIYIIPEMNKQGKYTMTSCVLTNLISSKTYILRVYAFYCGDGYCGYGKYGTEIAFRTFSNGKDIWVTTNCGPLEHLKNDDAYNTSLHNK